MTTFLSLSGKLHYHCFLYFFPILAVLLVSILFGYGIAAIPAMHNREKPVQMISLISMLVLCTAEEQLKNLSNSSILSASALWQLWGTGNGFRWITSLANPTLPKFENNPTNWSKGCAQHSLVAASPAVEAMLMLLSLVSAPTLHPPAPCCRKHLCASHWGKWGLRLTLPAAALRVWFLATHSTRKACECTCSCRAGGSNRALPNLQL